MLTIRLSRVGKNKQPSYRLIVSEKARDPWGKYLENVGFYNPRSNPPEIKFNAERIKFWMSKGAQLSDTVNNLLIGQKILSGNKRKIIKLSKKRKIKLAEKSAKGGSASGGKKATPAPAAAPAPEAPVAA